MCLVNKSHCFGNLKWLIVVADNAESPESNVKGSHEAPNNRTELSVLPLTRAGSFSPQNHEVTRKSWIRNETFSFTMAVKTRWAIGTYYLAVKGKKMRSTIETAVTCPVRSWFVVFQTIGSWHALRNNTGIPFCVIRTALQFCVALEMLLRWETWRYCRQLEV